MVLSYAAERALKEGDLHLALAKLQEDIRARPSDARLRVFLFQLLCVLGQWERALNQLKVSSEMEPLALPMAQMYGEAIRCEAIREEVYAGHKSPMILGEPDEWLALLIESRLRAGRGETAQAEDLRAQAFEQAPGSSGDVDGRPFDWIADADSRLGPMLEIFMDGKYYWVPFCRIAKIESEKPSDLRDLVWLPAQFTWTNGGAVPGHIPARYPGTEQSTDDQLRLNRQTQWREENSNTYLGLGHRILSTDAKEYPLLECRNIELLSS